MRCEMKNMLNKAVSVGLQTAKKPVLNWKTTLAGLIGGLCGAGAIIFPEYKEPLGVISMCAFSILGITAKDSEKEK